MRIALWVVVVAAHLLVIWLFMASRRAAREEELAFAGISLLPEPSQPRLIPPAEARPTQHGRATLVPPGTGPLPPSGPPPMMEEPTLPTAPAPDWRAQAEVVAESSAQKIVTNEDDAERRANALKAPYKPMPGPRVRGPAFGWDLMPRHRITPVGHGAFVLPVNDQCAFVFIIVPFFGCSLGPKPEANGDLFKYMRGPVKYGDWDWRVKDP
jgi:hypothetical protein